MARRFRTRTEIPSLVAPPVHDDARDRLPLRDLPVATLVADVAGRIISANSAASELLATPVAELRRQSLRDVLGRDLIWASGSSGARSVSLAVALPGGFTRNVEAFVSSGLDGDVAGSTVVVLLPEAAPLATRQTVAPRVQQWSEVADAARSLGDDTLCAHIGLVGLQAVNSSFSRSTGDAVLTEVAARLRGVAGERGVVARVSGERFSMLTPAGVDVAALLDRALDAVREPIETPLGRVAVGCSIGAVVGDARSATLLIDRADRNLTAALRGGAGIVEWDGRVEPPTTGEEARLAGSLVDAVADGLIIAHFQPVVDLRTGNVVEYEALARWNYERRGDLDAARFIQVARTTGAIVELGAAVLRAALQLVLRLRAEGDEEARVSVNLSTRELIDSSVVDLVSTSLAAAGLPGSVLQIEVSDEIAPDEVADVGRSVAMLRALGVRVALDGFGDRHADVGLLRDLMVDVVKLDPAVIRHVDERARDVSLLRSILALTADLGIAAVAKGVETETQHDVLRRMGCSRGQGYLYGRPVGADEIVAGVRGHVEAGHRSTGDGPFRRAPVGDAARVRAVEECLIAGAATSASFDDIARLAASMCGAPMAAISLVTADHQMVLAQHGDWLADRPLERSICAMVVLGDRPIEVSDAQGDELLAVAAADLGVRFYAGFPLRTSDGHAVATLCVADPAPRGLDDEQRASVRRLADDAATRLDTPRLLARLRAALASEDDAKAALAAEQQATAAMLGAMIEPIVVVDGSGIVRRASAAAAGVLGAGLDDILGHPFLDRVTVGARPVTAKFVRSALGAAAPPPRIEVDVLGPDGRTIRVNIDAVGRPAAGGSMAVLRLRATRA